MIHLKDRMGTLVDQASELLDQVNGKVIIRPLQPLAPLGLVLVSRALNHWNPAIPRMTARQAYAISGAVALTAALTTANINFKLGG